MERLNGWLRKQAARERKAVFLEDALLARRFRSYALYRLRYFLARTALASAVHLVHVVLLVNVFSTGDLGGLVLAHVAAGAGAAFWWGGLEEMRQRVRELYRSGRPNLVPCAIGQWLSLSVQLAAGVLILSLAWLAWRLASGGPSFGASDLYLLTVCVRFALELVVRCYHSGIYAIRRIYRPFGAMVAVDVAGLAAVLVLWPWLGAWSLAIAQLVAAVAVSALTLHYTTRLYRFLEFRPLAHLHLRQLRLPSGVSLPDVWAGGAAAALMTLDALVVVALVLTDRQQGSAGTLFVVFFALGPALRAGFEWAQLFYFDLTRLGAAPFRNLRRWFERRVLGVALAVGLALWALAVAAVPWLPGRHGAGFWWAAGPFFVARSLLAALQVQAFTEGRYRRVAVSGAGLLTGLIIASAAASGEVTLLLALAGTTLVAAVPLATGRELTGRGLRGPNVLPAVEWLGQLAQMTDPVRVGVARVPPRADAVTPGEREDRWRSRELARLLAKTLHGRGAVAVIRPGRVLWYERAGGADPEPGWLLTKAAGLPEAVAETGPQPNGKAALHTARARGFLGRDVCQPAPANVATARQVRALFHAMVPGGTVYDPDRPAPAALAALGARERRAVIASAAAFTRDLSPTTYCPENEVTAFCEDGQLRLIFVVPRAVARRQRLRWRSTIRRLHLDVALRPASRPDDVVAAVVAATGCKADAS